MANSFLIVPKEDWARFGNLCYSFLNSISNDFKYKMQQNVDKSVDDPLEYRKLATPIIALFIAFGYSERDLIEENIKIGMKPSTRITSLNYLKSRGYNQVSMLKLIVNNWDSCPILIKELLRKTNKNFVFPVDKVVIEPEPNKIAPVQTQQIIHPSAKPPVTVMPVNQRQNFTFTQRDLAIAKYVKVHLIDKFGYNSADSIKRLFIERATTDFRFNGYPELLTMDDYQRVRFSIIDYAKINFLDILGIENSERIYFNKFKQILERFVVAFPYNDKVVENEVTQLPTQQALNISISEPAAQPPQATQPKPTPQISEIISKVNTNNNNPATISSQTAQMIALLVDGMETSQVRMAFALLQDSSSLQEFGDAITRKFVQLQSK